MPYKDIEKQREAARRYNKTHKDQRATWQRANRPKLNARKRELRLLRRPLALCCICSAPNSGKHSLARDHDHTTGRFRGFLCHNCNTGLGKFKDNTTLLEKAITYLNATKTGHL